MDCCVIEADLMSMSIITSDNNENFGENHQFFIVSAHTDLKGAATRV